MAVVLLAAMLEDEGVFCDECRVEDVEVVVEERGGGLVEEEVGG